MTYESIIRHLETGREIEFTYKGLFCSISNFGGIWYFSTLCGKENKSKELCKFEGKKGLVKDISKTYVKGILVKEIFDKNLYDEDSLCIY